MENLPHFLLRFLERIRVPVPVLVGRDDAFLLASLIRVESSYFVRMTYGVRQFGHRAQKPGPVYFHFSVLFAQPEFYCEKV